MWSPILSSLLSSPRGTIHRSVSEKGGILFSRIVCVRVRLMENLISCFQKSAFLFFLVGVEAGDGVKLLVVVPPGLGSPPHLVNDGVWRATSQRVCLWLLDSKFHIWAHQALCTKNRPTLVWIHPGWLFSGFLHFLGDSSITCGQPFGSSVLVAFEL